MKTKKNKTSKVSLGTLYDLNKAAVIKEISLTGDKLEEKKPIIIDFLKNANDTYYMLLCNERKDYTVFELSDQKQEKILKDLADCLVDECLLNRGLVKGIDITKDQGAIEIWLSIDEEAFVYYFFPYGSAIVKI